MNGTTNNIFDEFDILEEEPAEQAYRRNAGVVSEQFEGKMALVGRKLNFARDLIALYRYFLDPDVRWYRKAIVAGALVYFISPLDSIPDLAPLIGYLDDLGVILATVKFLGSEIEPYYTR